MEVDLLPLKLVELTFGEISMEGVFFHVKLHGG